MRKLIFRYSNNLLIALSAVLILAAYGCTTIPESDTTTPEVTLEIRGPGIGRKVMHNPPREVWEGARGDPYFELAPDTAYRFSFRVTDSGGVAEVRMVLPSIFVITGLSDRVEVQSGRGSQTLSLRGLRASPTGSLTVSGTIQTPTLARNKIVAFDIQAGGVDFGGTSGGGENGIFMRVQIGLNGNM